MVGLDCVACFWGSGAPVFGVRFEVGTDYCVFRGTFALWFCVMRTSQVCGFGMV